MMGSKVKIIIPFCILCVLLFLGGCAKKLTTIKSEVQDTPAPQTTTGAVEEKKVEVVEKAPEVIAQAEEEKPMQEEQVTAPPEPQKLATETQQPMEIESKPSAPPIKVVEDTPEVTTQAGEEKPMQEEQVTAPPEPQELAMVVTPEPEIKSLEAIKEIGLQDIFFDFDKAVIREDTKNTLYVNADWLSKHHDIKIYIEGHADERGTTEYNLALGEKRAQAVKKYLISLGIDSQRISIISYGEEKPFCTESNEECWHQNRRGHFLIKEK